MRDKCSTVPRIIQHAYKDNSLGPARLHISVMRRRGKSTYLLKYSFTEKSAHANDKAAGRFYDIFFLISSTKQKWIWSRINLFQKLVEKNQMKLYSIDKSLKEWRSRKNVLHPVVLIRQSINIWLKTQNFVF